MNSNFITTTDCSINLPTIGRRSYINSATGRQDLKADCEHTNNLELYAVVMKTWGNMPTVEDETLPELTLDELKTAKINELTTAFVLRTQGAIKTEQGYNMQFDTVDCLKMEGAIKLMEAVGTTVGYITQANDETIYNVSIDTMKQVLIEMLSAYAKCHARKQELRKLITKAQSKEELTEITISWPV